MKIFARLLLGCLVFVAGCVAPVEQSRPGDKQSAWNGFGRVDFEVAGRACWVVVPKVAAPGRPWIWRTEFFGHEPQADLALLARGWHVAYLDAKNMYGAPKAIALMEQFYAHMTKERRLAKRVVLEGFSRGGLYAFNYAVAHPQQVAALYLDAPVLDIRSWPGKKPESKEWRECLAVYGLTTETVAGFTGGPLDNVAVVAKARVPILSVCGGADKTVPLAENTARLETRYRELGGLIEVIVKDGGDHHPHSLKDPARIVDFLVKHARF
jgi:pimeloyl-ACP methyl ester carboxylesterase